MTARVPSAFQYPTGSERRYTEIGSNVPSWSGKSLVDSAYVATTTSATHSPRITETVALFRISSRQASPTAR